MLTLVFAVVQQSYDRLQPMAGAAWSGCRAAVDFGQAIMLSTGVGGGSVVSLGVAANRPAKRLAQPGAVRAAHVSIPTELLPDELTENRRSAWTEILVKDGSDAVMEWIDAATARAVSERGLGADLGAVRVAPVTARYFDESAKTGAYAPVRIQGFCLRADLDGFSRQVEAATQAGQDAILDLARRFLDILSLPEAFASKFTGRVVILPWAGDCATLILLPRDPEEFSMIRASLPANAALLWHSVSTADDRLRTGFPESGWALGLAAGDAEEGNDGWMLLAEIRAQGRTFRVAGGWAACRANEACQHEGSKAEDAVISARDYEHLAPVWQKAFDRISTLFCRSSVSRLNHVQTQAIAQAAAATRAASPVSQPLPEPRPFARK